ncbi:MAG: O-antigen ligase family protein [Patescibacteria group bacterium]|jgi:putative inorganic carbon (HCO3(-)) transporter
MFKLVMIILIATVFLVPFYFFRFDLLGVPTNIFEVAIFAAILAAIVDLVAKKRRVNWGGIWPYLLLVSVLVGAIISEDKTRAAGIAKGWFIAPILLYWLMINFGNKSSIRKIVLAQFFAMIVIALWAILQRFEVVGLLFYQKGDPSFLQYLGDTPRSFGPFESPNYLAMYLVPTIFISLSTLTFIRPIGQRLILASGLIIAIIALLLSGSRGGVIALALALLVLLVIIIGRRLGKQASLLIAALIAALSLFSIWKIAPAQDQARIEIYAYSVEMIQSHPFAGIGLGSFRDEITKLSVGNPTFIEHGLPFALHPHNLYLAIWLNLGLSGLLVFGLLLWGFLRKARSDNGGVGLFALLAMVAILAHGLVDTTYFKNDLAALFWLIYAIPYLPSENDENKF